MQLKHLAVCLMVLNLSACSQYVTKANTHTGKSLEQKAVTGLNAMFETSEYDYQGKLNIHAEASPDAVQNSKITPKETVPKLDPILQKQMENYLHAQNIRLGHKEKQSLYTALAKEQPSSADGMMGKKGYAGQFDHFALSLLNNIQFSYNGSVHYREKLASFNLEAKYEKPTLLVHAKVPMVVDLNAYKFYINYFSFMPYLVNKDSQTSFAYIDFSKYKNEINRVDLTKLVDYLKQTNALSYALADPKMIQAIAVTSPEKDLAVVEKIRLTTTVEQLQLQQALYQQVNRPYMLHSILGIKDAEAEKDAVQAKADAAQAVDVTAPQAAHVLDASDEATESTAQLSQLLDVHFSALSQESPTGSIAVAQADQEKVVASDTVQIADSDSDQYLSDEQCQRLMTQPQDSTMGALTFCQNEYALNAFDLKESKPELEAKQDKSALDRLSPIFKPYASGQFIDAKTFTGLWTKHQSEIQHALKENPPQIPMLIDVGLDAQGRVNLVDYDIQIASKKYGKVNIQADMNIQNYGHARSIDRSQLRQAKSLEEVSKGSLIENMMRGLSNETGVEPAQTEAVQKAQTEKSFNEQLQQLATRTYQKTHSYAQTYQAVWGMQIAVKNNHLLKNYNAKSLQEIALVYAYWFADEQVYKPTATELAQIEALQQKHDLNMDQQFDPLLGDAVYQTVVAAIHKETEHQIWQKLAKQYKQPKAIFAQQYMQNFEQDYDVDQPEQLKIAADILAQTYLDSTKHQLSVKSIETLTLEQKAYIDLALYKKTYAFLQENLKIKRKK